MNTHRIRIGTHVAKLLAEHHLAKGKSTESISIALGHAYTSSEGAVTVVLADPGVLFLFDQDCYVSTGYAHAVLREDVRAAVCWKAIQGGYTAIVDIHDHHFARVADFSAVDDRDDLQTANYMRKTLPRFARPDRQVTGAALLLARDEWAARIVSGDSDAQHAAPMRVDIVASRDQPKSRQAPEVNLGAYVRQSSVVPPKVQARLRGLHVAVVGAGGTGSITAETLARLGFGKLTLIDADLVEASNLNRLQGGSPLDLGLPKARQLAQRLLSLVPDCQVKSIVTDVFSAEARQVLEQADLIVGCVDNAETRWWLNRFAVQFLVPYFDCGVLIETDPTWVLRSRVHAIIPGAGPCGHCTPMEFFPRNRPARFLDAATLATQRTAGYIAETPDMTSDAAIYPLNQLAVSWLAQEIIAWVAGGRPLAHTVSYSSGNHLVERVELDAMGGGGAEDCPLCASLMGSCRTEPLPAVGDADRPSINFQLKELHHGQDES